MLGPCWIGLFEGPLWSLLNSGLFDYRDPAGSLKILLEYTLVAVDFPYNEFLECFLQLEYIGLLYERHHRLYNL